LNKKMLVIKSGKYSVIDVPKGKITIKETVDLSNMKVWVNNHAHVLRFTDMATQKFVETYVNSIPIDGFVTGAAQPKLNQQALNSILIPQPDIDIQREIVAQIEAEQRAVNANKALIRLFEDKIKATINRVWGEAE